MDGGDEQETTTGPSSAQGPGLRMDWALATAGLAAGFSGLAIIVTILTGVALLATEAALVLVPGAAVLLILRRSSPGVRRAIWLFTRAGIVSGASATLVYDLSRTALSVLDPSPYNPFEAIRHFGLGMLPVGAAPGLVLGAGFAIHFVNGSSFGVIYTVAAGIRARRLRSALIAGIVWGLTLELIQSILYPGWLGITTVLREFMLISGLGHVAYGVTLAVGVRRILFGRWGSDRA
jgi:hypothetical protein